MIFTQIKEVLKKMGSQQTEHEALVAFDFKLIDFKTALMQLCFSSLSNWGLFLWILILNFNPFRYHYQILHGAGALSAFLFTPQWTTGLIIGLISSYFLRIHWLLVGVVLYFISQAEINTVLSFSIIFGVLLGEILRRFKLALRLKSMTRKMYLWFNLLQVIHLIIGVYVSFNLYQLMFNAGLFSRTLFAYRFELIAVSLFLYFIVQTAGNSIWGHFYALKKIDPSQINIFYSSSPIFSKFNLSRKFKESIFQQAEVKLNEMNQNFSDPELSLKWPSHLKKAMSQEKSYLEDIKNG